MPAQIVLNGQTWTTSGPSTTGAVSYMCTGSISLAATNMGVKDHITVAGSGWTGTSSGGYKGDIINVHWSEGKGNKTHDWKPFDKVAGYPREMEEFIRLLFYVKYMEQSKSSTTTTTATTTTPAPDPWPALSSVKPVK